MDDALFLAWGAVLLIFFGLIIFIKGNETWGLTTLGVGAAMVVGAIYRLRKTRK